MNGRNFPRWWTKSLPAIVPAAAILAFLVGGFSLTALVYCAAVVVGVYVTGLLMWPLWLLADWVSDH